MKRIPKIIHQTWMTNELPEILSELPQTWKALHPEWEYILWTDEMNREFIKVNFPSFLSHYDSYSTNIQRVDAVRYFILYQTGGLFVDLDFECLKSFDPLLLDHECVFGLEPMEHCVRFSKHKIICNALMASTPGSEFFGTLCSKLFSTAHIVVNHPVDVLNSTGPFFLTTAFDHYPNQEQIRLLSPEQVYPLTIGESKSLLYGDISNEVQHRINAAYGVHYFLGNW